MCFVAHVLFFCSSGYLFMFFNVIKKGFPSTPSPQTIEKSLINFNQNDLYIFFFIAQINKKKKKTAQYFYLNDFQCKLCFYLHTSF